MILPDPPILVITDRTRCAEPLEDRAAALFRGGCRWLSLREKDLDPAARLALLRRLMDVGQAFGAIVGVHDDLAAAALCGGALHLPARSDAAKGRQAAPAAVFIGKSCHDAAEIALAAAQGADYATLSPVFATASKPGYVPTLDRTAIARTVREAALPVLALGGVTPDTLPGLSGTGLTGIAVMGGAMTAPDPEAWFRALVGAWRQAVAGSAMQFRRA